ncbi:MAG: SAM-dependent chlorinase/fluorinase [Eubacterium sp.]|nr:SAM-dependent chlorinase/fluorinase [Eubacterium sp.]MBQ3412437.1 SAM-dependent chlorinase/fluorinase [Oscillospiraceae bacterium]
MKPCIVLQSDFGLSTGLPASMTAVIVKLDPEIRVFDLCHEVREYDIREGASILASTFPYWPDGTIFVSVVDPGVGTNRRSCVALMDNGSYVVTPDNGTLSLLFDRICEVREIDEKVNRMPGSDDHHTFHGRDVYAYTAARLASGIIGWEGIGPLFEKESLVRFPAPSAEIIDGEAFGEVTGAHDHFGNVGISIPNEMIKQIGIGLGDMCRVRISKDGKDLYDKEMMFHKSFGWVAPGEPILNECSNDYVEISINQGSFCDIELPELLKAYDVSVYKVRISPVPVKEEK